MKNRSKRGEPRLTKALSDSSRYWPIISIVILAVCIRLYGVTNPLYDLNYWRQTETAALARNYHEDNLPFLYPEVDWIGPHGHAEMEFPLYPYILSWIYRILWPSEIFGRLLTILCSAGAILAIWDIVRQTINRRIALLAAAFFAASPLAVYFGRTYQPDMMMVFFSTASISCLLRWMGESKNVWFYCSAILLALGVLLKPPCLLVVLPLSWILYKQEGQTFILNKENWIYASIVIVPAILWYAHAQTFFEETGATFMWHFKNFSVERHLFSVWSSFEFWTTIGMRFTDGILAYVGLLPFIIGIWRLFYPWPGRALLGWWVAGVAVFYLAIPGHHIGHTYYSLLAIPPAAIITAIGCDKLGHWLNSYLHFSYNWIVLLPLITAILGFSLLISRNYYGKLYYYYDDALALRQLVPENELIAVKDDLMHTPEFFYFINRNGWHLANYPAKGTDNSPWIEKVRKKGAAYYFGLTEFQGNHPLLYLQDYLHGQYIWDHYVIQDIGFKYFAARLDQPIYGNHLFSQYKNKKIAIPDMARNALNDPSIQTVSLYEWQSADAILLDFHKVHPEEMNSIRTNYENAAANGFVVTHQESGRLVLEKSGHIKPVTGLIDSVGSSQLVLTPQLPNGRFYLGYFEKGRHRVSFRFSQTSFPDPVTLAVEDRFGNTIQQRVLQPVHFPHLSEGERPECIFTLDQPLVLYAAAYTEKGLIRPESIVWMPDVQCVQTETVIQTEQLHTNMAMTVTDAKANRNKALWGWTEDEPRFIFHGPFFHYPSGLYEMAFRLRAPNKWNPGTIEVGVYADGNTTLAHQELYPYYSGENSLGRKYSKIPLSARIRSTSTIEMRALLHPNAEALIDTIHVHQQAKTFKPRDLNNPLCLIPRDGQTKMITPDGRIIGQAGTIQRRVRLVSSPIAWAAWNQNTGELYIDEAGRIIGEKNEEYWSIQRALEEKIINFNVSPDGLSIGVLTDKGRVFIWHQGEIETFTIPATDFPFRDLLVLGKGKALVLDRNGGVIPVGEAQKIEGLPVFWSDVARAFIHHPDGIYVVDCLGAIHSSSGLEPIHSPLYRPENWIIDAYRMSNGIWVFLSKTGEIHTFQE